MYTLWSLCKQRYTVVDTSSELQAQQQAVESMPPEARKTLTERIVQTLAPESDPDSYQHNNNNDSENVAAVPPHSNSSNVERLLEEVEGDLETAQKQLSALEGKEEFISVRIRKYQALLKDQDTHLKKLNERHLSQGETAASEEEQPQQQQHYHEQVQKQQKHKEALGKVVDIHMDILKHIKDCKRNITTLQNKKNELTNITKQCREFLVMATEAEREQQMGIVMGDDTSDVELGQTTEMAPLNISQEESRMVNMVESDPTATLIDEETRDSNVVEGDCKDGNTDVKKSELPLQSAASSATVEVPIGAEGLEEIPAKVEPDK